MVSLLAWAWEGLKLWCMVFGFVVLGAWAVCGAFPFCVSLWDKLLIAIYDAGRRRDNRRRGAGGR